MGVKCKVGTPELCRGGKDSEVRGQSREHGGQLLPEPETAGLWSVSGRKMVLVLVVTRWERFEKRRTCVCKQFLQSSL